MQPPIEVEISEQLVRALLREQAPERATLTLELLGQGWDNTNWRLGPDHVVRLPHRAVAAELISNEQRWLPTVAERVDLPVPVPVMAGKPSPALEYPWKWSIARWVPGGEAANTALTEPAESAATLGTFFRQLHRNAHTDAPVNPYRGGPLADRADAFSERLGALDDRIDTDAAREIFDQALEVPRTDERVWLHGDLHTRNVLVDNGRLSGIIDWGDMCCGDRAVDLAAAWMLTPDQVAVVADHADADRDAWARAKGWAVHFAVIYLGGDDIIQKVGEALSQSLGIATR